MKVMSEILKMIILGTFFSLPMIICCIVIYLNDYMKVVGKINKE